MDVRKEPACGRRVFLAAFGGSGSEDPRTQSTFVARAGALRGGRRASEGAVGHGAVGSGGDADACFEGVLDAHAAAEFVHQFEQPDGLRVRQERALDVAVAEHSFEFERLVLVAVAEEGALQCGDVLRLALQLERLGAPEVRNHDPPAVALDDAGGGEGLADRGLEVRLGAVPEAQDDPAVLVDPGRSEIGADLDLRDVAAGHPLPEDERRQRQRVAADIEQAAAAQFGIVEPALRIERRVEAEGADDPARLSDRAVGDPVGGPLGRGQEAGPHGLEQRPPPLAGDFAQPAGLGGIDAEWLLAEHPLAVPERQRRMLQVTGMGTGDVDGVDRLAAHQVPVGAGLGVHVAALGVEGERTLRVAAADGHDLVTVQPIDCSGEDAGDGARTDDSPTNGSNHDLDLSAQRLECQVASAPGLVNEDTTDFGANAVAHPGEPALPAGAGTGHGQGVVAGAGAGALHEAL